MCARIDKSYIACKGVSLMGFQDLFEEFNEGGRLLLPEGSSAFT